MHWTNSICHFYIRGYESGSSTSVCFSVYSWIQHSFFCHGFLYRKHEMDDNVLPVDDENRWGINDRNRNSSLHRQNDSDYDMAYTIVWRVYRILTTLASVDTYGKNKAILPEGDRKCIFMSRSHLTIMILVIPRVSFKVR